ncbi:acyltransferase family protein [Janibacter cremeus]|uniref:Peptidoglycan/LPS O-acetylase OafA/YrhL n=1 Tax=Janibacter cremeus TaxID=1285192 RepID=A0A852VTD3_9MICO|nr:acyltransferase [Janibacter cremeus]NYF99596.1 peptidoglycan/LPS O-acetylase OafA/YrhL [Janibacter cremeus]
MTATTSAPQHKSLPYRPAIDGLRAFAVLAVIAFHLLPGTLPGGWFGVDVFFVISGFLITALLLAEYRRERGRINLVGFWLARARRLLPALFVVLAAVLVGATFLTMSGRTGNVAGDVLATLGYVANWRFVLGDEAYFGQVASPSPLRHAWSLAVEEQFYLIYPMILIGLLALIRRRVTLFAVLTVVSGASAVLMAHLHHPGLDPSRIYYGTDTRAHQLLVGAAVAALISGGPGAIDRDKARILDTWCRRLALPALLVVLSAFWWAGPAQSVIFEGLAVPLSLAICVVLVAATSPAASLTQRLLSWEPLRRIGMVSYGLYLWHWPIIVFLNDQVLPIPTAPRVVLQVGLTSLLAWLSYRYVERPVRREGIRALVPRLPRASVVFAWAAVPALVVGAVTMPAAARTVATTTASPSELTIPQPAYRPGGQMVSVIFIGNSVPQSLITYFKPSNHPDLRLFDTTNIGCDPLAAAKFSNGKVQPEQEGCSAWRAGWGEEIASDDPDVVLYFVAHTMVTDRIDRGTVVEFGSPAWVDLIEEGLDSARSAAGSHQFAVINVSCHKMPTFNSEEIKRVNDAEYVTTLNEAVSAWAEDNNVPVLDQYSLLCPGGEYHDTINDVPLYQDAIHFTNESGPIFWRWLAPRLQRVSRGEDLS